MTLKLLLYNTQTLTGAFALQTQTPRGRKKKENTVVLGFLLYAPCVKKSGGWLKQKHQRRQTHRDLLTTAEIEQGRKHDWKHRCRRKENKNNYWEWCCKNRPRTRAEAAHRGARSCHISISPVVLSASYRAFCTFCITLNLTTVVHFLLWSCPINCIPGFSCDRDLDLFGTTPWPSFYAHDAS